MFKEIPGFSNYIINENGDIYSHISNKFLSQTIFANGYKVVTIISDDGIKKKCSVHRLVAITFLPNENNFPVVLHKDNNKLNCHISNLKWGTYSENNSQAIRDGLNKIPRPDNRKVYSLINENSPVYVDCLGIKNIISKIGFGNDSRIRNYIFRNSEIPYGDFSGWKIKLKS